MRKDLLMLLSQVRERKSELAHWSQDAGHAAIVENFCCNLDPIAGWPAMHASRNIAPYGDRTRDHTLTERMLYQLS